MECEEYKEKGILYLYDELSPEDMSSMEKHIKGCVYCKEHIISAREIRQRIGEIEVPDSPEVDLQDLYARSRSPLFRYPGFLKRLKVLSWRRLAPVAAVIMAMLLAGVIFKIVAHKTPSPQPGGEYAWNGRDDKSLDDFRLRIADIEYPRGSLYELNHNIERRWSEDSILGVKKIAAYEDEITELKNQMNYF